MQEKGAVAPKGAGARDYMALKRDMGFSRYHRHNLTMPSLSLGIMRLTHKLSIKRLYN